MTAPPPRDGHGFQVHVGPNKPRSRGRVKIRSDNVSDAPSILFNYLQHEEDRQAWRQCIHLTREIMSQPAMDPFRGSELQPGADVQSDAEIAAWLRQNIESAYHPAGTCKIGPATDNQAVVDPECRCMVWKTPGGGRLCVPDLTERQHQCACHHGGREDIRQNFRAARIA